MTITFDVKTPRTSMIAVLAFVVFFVGETALAQSGISFGPRFSFVYDNFLQTTSNSSSGDEIIEDIVDLNFVTSSIEAPQAEFLLIGGTVAVPTGLKNTEVVLSYQQGETDVENVITQTETTLVTGPNGGAEAFVRTDNIVRSDDLKRTDVEASVRRIFSTGDRLTLSAIGGVRYERTKSEVEVEGVFTSANTFDDGSGVFGFGTTTGNIDAVREYYSLRSGVGVYAPVNDRHGFYIDAQAALAYLDVSDIESSLTQTLFIPDFGIAGEQVTNDGVEEGGSSVLLGPDVTMGYRLNVSDRVGFDARYRSQIFYDIDGENRGVSQDPRILHGVNFGFSVNF